MVFRVATVIVILGLAGCGRSPVGVRPRVGGAVGSRGAANATVVRVVDGDTVVVRLGTPKRVKESVRLIGIDTPESVKPNTPVQCFALEASAHTKALLPPATAVQLVRDVDARDGYGRLLAYVYRSADGLFVNAELARDGYAVLDTIPPNVAHAGEFVEAVDAARRANAGLWARCGDDIPRHPSAPLPSPP